MKKCPAFVAPALKAAGAVALVVKVGNRRFQVFGCAAAAPPWEDCKYKLTNYLIERLSVTLVGNTKLIAV